MTTGPRYRIDVESDDHPRLVVVEGEIDMASVNEMEKALLVDPSVVVVADLTGVGFMDSTGLRGLLAAQDGLTAGGGRLHLVFEDGPVRRLLDLTGLADRFSVYPDRDSALHAAE